MGFALPPPINRARAGAAELRHRHEEGVDADVLAQEPGRLMEVARNIGKYLASTILHALLDQGTLDVGDKHAIGMNAVG